MSQPIQTPDLVPSQTRDLQRQRVKRLENDQGRIYLGSHHGTPAFYKNRKWAPPISEMGFFNNREMVGQRPFGSANMDPISTYYSLGADKHQHNLSIEDPNTLYGNYYSNAEDEELENLSYSPRNSVIVNWSYGGYQTEGLSRDIGEISAGTRNWRNRWHLNAQFGGGSVNGLTSREQEKYFAAIGGRLAVGDRAPITTRESLASDLIFPASIQNSAGRRPLAQDFNMPNSLDRLWEETSLDYEAEELMRNLYSHQRYRGEIKRDGQGIRIGMLHYVPWSPAATAMINSVGLVTTGGSLDDFRYSSLDHHADIQARWNPELSDRYGFSDIDELEQIRRVERQRELEQQAENADAQFQRRRARRFRQRSQQQIDNTILDIFEPGPFSRPETTIYDVYQHLLLLKGDSPSLREKLISVFLAVADDPLAREVRNIRIDGYRLHSPPSLSDISSGSYVEYEFYDFKKRTIPFVKDASTHIVESMPGTPGRYRASIQEAAFVNPEYNAYLEDYETAISDPRLSEKILPNMYIYQLAGSSQYPNDNNPDTNPPWDTSDPQDASELQGDYDKLIRFSEFTKNTLPLLKSDPSDEFIEGLNNFGSVSEGSQDTVFEFQSDLAKKYYNTTVEGGDIRIFNEFNHFKKSFPMYIELGIPTSAPGVFGQILGGQFTSAGVTNTIISSGQGASTEEFNLSTTSIVYNPNKTRPFEKLITITENLKVVDFEEWLSSLGDTVEDLEVQDIGAFGFNQNTYGPGGGNLQENSIPMLRFWVLMNAARNMPDYKDMLSGRRITCPTETIMYKLIKYKILDDGGREIVQNFYFPNTPAGTLPYGEKIVDIIKFVDTQVKYGQGYEYELHNIDAVYGAKYRFRRRFRETPNIQQRDPEDNRLFYSFNVETLPNVKIIEYPVITDSWSRAHRDNEMDVIYNNGVSYPPVAVVDRPPPPPDVQIYPYAGEPNKALVMLTPQGGAWLGNKARSPIPFNAEEAAQARLLNQHQRTFENFNLPFDRLEFKGEGFEEIKEMVVYRSETINQSPTGEIDIYSTFLDTIPLKIMSMRPGAPAAQRVASFDFVDSLSPNVKYYYTFKCRDVHGKVSFPSPVYEVQMISENGLFLPEVKIYDPDIKSSKNTSKSLIRFLEVSAADIQKLPVQESVESEPVSYSARSLVNGEGCIADADGNESNKFLLRLSSKDSGKKIDLVVNFKINEDDES